MNKIALPVFAMCTMVFSQNGFSQQPSIDGLEQRVKAQCEAPGILPQQTLFNLTKELQRVREATKKFIDQADGAFFEKVRSLSEINKWADANYVTFYRDLYGAGAYLDLDTEKARIVEQYMEINEMALANLADADYKPACARTFLLVEVMRGLDAVTRKQWKYLQDSVDSAIATARSRKAKP